MAFNLEILAPDKIFFDGQAEALTLTAPDGALTVLTGHAPMVSAVSSGVASIKIDGAVHTAFCSDGFLEVKKDKTSLFTQSAEWAENIDTARALEAKLRAEAKMREESVREHTHNEVSLARAVARLRIADKQSEKRP